MTGPARAPFGPTFSPVSRAISAALGSMFGFSFQSLMASYPTAEKWLWEAGALTDEKVAWRRNLLTTSDTLGGIRLGGGAKTNSTDFTSPSGSATVAKYVPASGNTNAQIYTGGNASSLPSQGTHTISVYFRKQASSYGTAESNISITMGGNVVMPAQTVYLLSALTPASPNHVGDGWYRLTHTYAPQNATHESFLSVGHLNGATANGTDAFYFANAQLEISSAPTAYQRITDFNTEFLAAYPQHTLFQDIGGRIPATKMEDPIALVIDTKAGYSIGPELLTNGDFTNGSTGWTLGADWTISGGVASRTTSAGNSALTSNIPATPNKTFEVRITGTVSAGTLFFFGPDAPVSLGVGTYVDHRIFLHMPSGAGGFISATASGASTVVSIDSISIRELSGYHLLQSTAANRMKITSRVNRQTYSEQFDNAAWSKVRISVTPNAAAAPDGTNTADQLVISGGGAAVLSQTMPSDGGMHTATIYAKAGTKTVIQFNCNAFSFGTDKRANFNLQNGTLGTVDAGITATIESVGNGWYRCSAATSKAATAGACIWSIVDSPTSAREESATAGNLLVWGAQLEFGSAFARYQRAVTATDYDYVGFPRLIEHDGLDDFGVTSRAVELGTQTSDGLARRNQASTPTALNTYVTLLAPIVTANAALAPDGTMTATQFEVASGQTAFALRNVGPGAIAGNNANSIYFKLVGATTGQLAVIRADRANEYCGVNVATQAPLSINGSGISNSSVSIEALPDGWYRLKGAYTSDAASETRIALTGSTAGAKILLWGVQVELSTLTVTDFQNIGTDKVTVFAGVEKLADPGSTAVFMELSGNYATNAGSFTIYAPNTSGQSYLAGVNGSALNSRIYDSYPAPSRVVFVTRLKTTAANNVDGVKTRIDGADIAGSSQLNNVSTGNFGNHSIFVGRRSGSQNPFRGRWSVLGGIGTLITDSQMTNLERALAKTQGRTL